MTEKIELYKEVLGLEPNSKLFFPLARLLVEDRRQDEAIDVLVRGLERHEEFLEARLYLIELLHAAGREDEVERQVKELTGRLATYAGFWRAWAACLEHSDNTGDASTALRFLALTFSQGSVSLRDVFQRGLASYEAIATSAGTAPTETVPEKSAADTSRVDSSHVDEVGMPASDSVQPPAPVNSGPVDAGLQIFEADDGAMPPPTDTPIAHLSPVEQEAVSSRGEILELEDMLETVPPHPLTKDFAEMADADSDMPSLEIEQPLNSAELTNAQDGSEGDGESVSLRTRSMAEVLAEQGDIRGALDIYQELSITAVDPEERAELRQRMMALSAGLGLDQAAVAPVEEIVEPSRGKERLINMLEILANRVEARARG